MRFRVVVTAGGEVIFAGHSRASRPVYYGAPPETGLWRISLPKFEGFMATELEPQSFGSSIQEFVFGFELAELEGWGQFFKATREYLSYRPKSKMLVSVGQLDWEQVKELAANDQLSLLGAALLASVNRVAAAKRKPRDFDHAAFAIAVRHALAKCTASAVEEHDAA
jgi:hypothetical protein